MNEFAACEQPLQSLAVSAAMHIAGWQLHSEHRITCLAINEDQRPRRAASYKPLAGIGGYSPRRSITPKETWPLLQAEEAPKKTYHYQRPSAETNGG